MSIRIFTIAAAFLTATAVAAPLQSAQKFEGECASPEKAKLTKWLPPGAGKRTQDLSSEEKRKMTALAVTPGEINDAIVANSMKARDGGRIASTGVAIPGENWFGCPPETDE